MTAQQLIEYVDNLEAAIRHDGFTEPDELMIVGCLVERFLPGVWRMRFLGNKSKNTGLTISEICSVIRKMEDLKKHSDFNHDIPN